MTLLQSKKQIWQPGNRFREVEQEKKIAYTFIIITPFILHGSIHLCVHSTNREKEVWYILYTIIGTELYESRVGPQPNMENKK